MKIRAGWVACIGLLLPIVAEAQTLTGLGEWAVGRGTSKSTGQAQSNSSFWQVYTLGLSSSLISPRLLKFNTEVSFRAGRLSLLDSGTGQQGGQRSLGYKAGAVLFPAGRFPFTIQASRDNVAESGDYPSSNGIRGGIVVPPGETNPSFLTRNTSLSMGWQLSFPTLPRVDIGYRKGSALVTGGPFRGEQRDDELHVGVTKETTHTHHTLRYQHNAYESPVSQAFNQRIDDLDYEFGATIATHIRTSTRIGQRNHFSMFDVPSASAGQETEAYRPPTRGAVNALFAVSSITFEPWRRFSFEVSGSFDRQRSAGATTDARMASGSAHVEPLRGLSIDAVGTYGDRGQVVGGVPLTVAARSGQAGVVYRAGVRWLQGSVGYSAGIGSDTTPDGRVGSTRSESGQASLSASFKGIGISGGYERNRHQDEILDYGNAFVEREHVAIQSQLGQFQLNGSGEQLRVDRGRNITFSANRQRAFSASLSLRLGRSSVVAASAGGFTNEGSYGRDHSFFAGLTLDAQLAKSLRLSAWVRRGDAVASLTRLSQATLSGYVQVEYKLRQFNLALEYRRNDQNLVTGEQMNPYQFRGHQLMLRVSRRFGIRV